MWWAHARDLHGRHEGLLNPTEAKRRASYSLPPDRDVFTLGVVITRAVLGAHLQIAPERVVIDRTCPDCARPHGWPRLPHAPDITISVSHSGSCVAVAFALGPRIGLDVESLHRTVRPGLADVVLSEPERAALDRTTPGSLPSAFLRYWVRKEAVLKATGDGLRVPPADVTVSAPDQAPTLLAWSNRPGLPSRMSLVDLASDSQHLASLAVLDGLLTPQELDIRGILAALQ